VTLDRLGDEDMQNRIRIDEPWAILGHLGPSWAPDWAGKCGNSWGRLGKLWNGMKYIELSDISDDLS